MIVELNMDSTKLIPLSSVDLCQVFRNFGYPFVGPLLALSVISFLVGAIEAGSLISFMVVVSVLLRFIQEFARPGQWRVCEPSSERT